MPETEKSLFITFSSCRRKLNIKELPHKFKVVKVNVNFDDKLAEEYEVAASPTLLFFKEGKEVERIRGLAKRPAIEKVIEKLF